jgi:hypothetical protein
MDANRFGHLSGNTIGSKAGEISAVKKVDLRLDVSDQINESIEFRSSGQSKQSDPSPKHKRNSFNTQANNEPT